jgi:hypothetical protein
LQSATSDRELAIGNEVFSLPAPQLGLLLAALAEPRERDADAVREQIAALSLLSDPIRLTPTQGELSALRSALAALNDESA